MTRTTDSLPPVDGGRGDRLMSHDARGNLTGAGAQTMAYDYDGQITSVSGSVPGIGPTSGTYLYDGENKRVRSTVNGRDMFYVYDSRGRLIRHCRGLLRLRLIHWIK